MFAGETRPSAYQRRPKSRASIASGLSMEGVSPSSPRNAPPFW
jgi:hypothetical protein